MIINTPVSLGELLDKISILIIKDKKITDIEKKTYVKEELETLNNILKNSIEIDQVQEYIDKLIEVNSKLWKIEDDIRECERKKNFNENFIQLAISGYFTNDKRAELKLKINKKFGSKLVEVKSYNKY